MKRYIGGVAALVLLLAGCGGGSGTATAPEVSQSAAAVSTGNTVDILSDPEVTACATVAGVFDRWRLAEFVPFANKLGADQSSIGDDDLRNLRNSMVTPWKTIDGQVANMGDDPAAADWAQVVTSMREYVGNQDAAAPLATLYANIADVARNGESATASCSDMIDRKTS